MLIRGLLLQIAFLRSQLTARNFRRRHKVKTLSDEQLSEVIQRDTTKWAVTNKEFLMEVARAVAEAQAKLTARDIFAESDKLILEPLPSTRLSNNFGVVIRESYNELKKQFGAEE